MYQKKDYIFSETLGVCKVEDITKLSQKKGETLLYYVLRPVNDKEKTAYIPVEHHEVVLRNLITLDEAISKKEKNDEKENILSKQEAEFVINRAKQQK